MVMKGHGLRICTVYHLKESQNECKEDEGAGKQLWAANSVGCANNTEPWGEVVTRLV